VRSGHEITDGKTRCKNGLHDLQGVRERSFRNEGNIDRQKTFSHLGIKSRLESQDLDPRDRQAHLVPDPRLAQLVDAQRGDQTPVLLADKPCDTPFIHQLQMIADRTLTRHQALFLHPACDQAGAQRPAGFMKNAQNQKRFSLDVFLIGKHGNHRQSAIICRWSYTEWTELSIEIIAT